MPCPCASPDLVSAVDLLGPRTIRVDWTYDDGDHSGFSVELFVQDPESEDWIRRAIRFVGPHDRAIVIPVPSLLAGQRWTAGVTTHCLDCHNETPTYTLPWYAGCCQFPGPPTITEKGWTAAGFFIRILKTTLDAVACPAGSVDFEITDPDEEVHLLNILRAAWIVDGLYYRIEYPWPDPDAGTYHARAAMRNACGNYSLFSEAVDIEVID